MSSQASVIPSDDAEGTEYAVGAEDFGAEGTEYAAGAEDFGAEGTEYAVGAEDFDAEGAEYAAGAEEIKGSPMRQQCLAHELRSRGLRVEQQVRIPIIYKGLRLPNAYRVDLLVDGEVVVELKSVKQLHELHHAQLLSYLKLMKKRVGLLINFHSLHLKDGIKRMVNDF